MDILIASLKPAKVEAVRDAVFAIAALDARFANAALLPVEVAHDGAPMPMTEASIIEGARRRVVALTQHASGEPDRYLVGLEGGLDPIDGGLYALKTWACVSDGAIRSFGAGGAFVLPDYVSQAVVGGRELGDVVDEIAGTSVRGTRGAWGLFTRDLVTRRDAFRTAVLAAFAPFYNREFFHDRRPLV